jgi:hypothetical protein
MVFLKYFKENSKKIIIIKILDNFCFTFLSVTQPGFER